MVTEELLAYVRQQRAAGVPDEALKKALTTQGWNETDITQAFEAVNPPSPGSGTPIDQKHTATMWRRFWNSFVDGVFLWLFSFLFFFIVDKFVPSSFGLLALQLLLWPFMVIFYYVFFESIWQRTPAKWITRTKVVKLDGTKPNFASIVGRSFCRYIPFEIFSFLFGAYPFGWHDRLSGTMVVPASYSVAEAASINPRDKGKSHVGIIVLVIFLLIPAIGIFSSIVLVSLGSARQKSADVSITADMQSVLLESALYQANNNSYQGFCSQPEAIADLQTASIASGDTPDAYVCNDSPANFAASVPQRSAGYVCVDASSTQPDHILSNLGTQTSCGGI